MSLTKGNKHASAIDQEPFPDLSSAKVKVEVGSEDSAKQ
jgi:hypothetical protein